MLFEWMLTYPKWDIARILFPIRDYSYQKISEEARNQCENSSLRLVVEDCLN